MAHMLVVDDDPVSRTMMTQILSGWGHWVVASSDGAHALDIWRCNKKAIDVLITDFQMPNLDGRGLVQAILAEEPVSPPPVIMVSGAVSIHQIDDLLGAGVSFFLPKPVDFVDLKDYVHECCDHTKAVQEAVIRP
jgi:two-component system chemotaxis response regulator CheY